MGGKRRKSESEAMEDYGSDVELDRKEKKKKMEKGKTREILPSMIKNKEKRSAVHAKLKHEKKVEKRKKLKARDAEEKRALELGEEVRSPIEIRIRVFVLF
jgi:ribosome production factor 1